MDRRTAIRSAVAGLVVSIAGIAGVKQSEGLGPRDAAGNAKAYVDREATSRVVTICYGHTATARLGQTRTPEQCDALLMRDLNTIYAPIVRRLVTVPLTQGEFNALVDFVYNVGEPKFKSSTLLKLVNAGQYDKAALEFEKWHYTGGKNCLLPESRCGGIPKRRKWEKEMFLS